MDLLLYRERERECVHIYIYIYKYLHRFHGIIFCAPSRFLLHYGMVGFRSILIGRVWPVRDVFLRIVQASSSASACLSWELNNAPSQRNDTAIRDSTRFRCRLNRSWSAAIKAWPQQTSPWIATRTKWQDLRFSPSAISSFSQGLKVPLKMANVWCLKGI